MGFPTGSENFKGYDVIFDIIILEMKRGIKRIFRFFQRSNVSTKAANFIGKNFMLMHGTLDDNVHFQNTAQLARALTQAGALFRTQVTQLPMQIIEKKQQLIFTFYSNFTYFLGVYGQDSRSI